jgi:hypothetical protein
MSQWTPKVMYTFPLDKCFQLEQSGNEYRQFAIRMCDSVLT